MQEKFSLIQSNRKWAAKRHKRQKRNIVLLCLFVARIRLAHKPLRIPFSYDRATPPPLSRRRPTILIRKPKRRREGVDDRKLALDWLEKSRQERFNCCRSSKSIQC